MAKKQTKKKVVERAKKFGAKLYKVLVKRGNKWTGGHTSFDWTPYLPTATGPGKVCRVPTTRKLDVCEYGLHVTSKPSNWGGHKDCDPKFVRIFEVAVFGPVKRKYAGCNKICAYAVQLVREIKPPSVVSEWDQVRQASYQAGQKI